MNFLFIDRELIINKETFDVIQEISCCFICHGIVIQPFQCTQCESISCKFCINKWCLRKNACPLNCTGSRYKPATRVIKNLLSKLILRCTYGCKEHIKYENLITHQETCSELINQMEEEMARQYKIDLERNDFLLSETVFQKEFEEDIERYYHSEMENDHDYDTDEYIEEYSADDEYNYQSSHIDEDAEEEEFYPFYYYTQEMDESELEYLDLQMHYRQQEELEELNQDELLEIEKETKNKFEREMDFNYELYEEIDQHRQKDENKMLKKKRLRIEQDEDSNF
jgi:hypothetical protein